MAVDCTLGQTLRCYRLNYYPELNLRVLEAQDGSEVRLLYAYSAATGVSINSMGPVHFIAGDPETLRLYQQQLDGIKQDLIARGEW